MHWIWNFNTVYARFSQNIWQYLSDFGNEHDPNSFFRVNRKPEEPLPAVTGLSMQHKSSLEANPG